MTEPNVPASTPGVASTLAPGRRLGPYEVVAPIGAGGMGEVYLARDTRLDRTVAIKILPGHLSAEPEVRARFEREARAVSSLNHPHICTLYDVGHDEGVDYLVMEHLEGQTLAERIVAGPMPADEILRIGVQVADALDRAHRQGLVHRDLKPGNIMLTRQGAKLLDFGLARVTGLDAAPPGSSGHRTIGSSVMGTVGAVGTPNSPTMGRPLTAEGTIVGTFQYMAPEQLEGREADARSDLWALGATLYEMATGRHAFGGGSQASLIASILKEQPRPISELVPLAPPGLDRLVRACLAKDPDDRVQTAHDVKLQLQWIAEGGSQAGVPAPVGAARRRHERVAWAVAAVASLIALALGTWSATRPTPRRFTTRFDIIAPPGVNRMLWPTLSPDGRLLAFQGTDSTGQQSIYVRPLDATTATPLVGTGGSGRPFWSPDGQFLAFFADGKLKKVPSGGGPVQLVADTPGASDGSWGGAGTILFDGSNGDSLRAVPASGGVPAAATRIDHAIGEHTHAWPAFLPDGRSFLFVAQRGKGMNLIKLGRLGSPESVLLDSTESRVQFVEPGYVLFARGGILLARRIDVGGRRCVGEPFALAEGMVLGNTEGNFSGSFSGNLVYQAQGAAALRRIEVYDRGGRRIDQIGQPDSYGQIAPSPDGTRLALTINDRRSNNADVWVRDLKRGTVSRLTFDPEDDIWPVWSPDSRQIAFASNRGGFYRIYTKYASGAGDDVPLPGTLLGHQGPVGWSSDGKVLTCAVFNAGSWDAYVRTVADSTAPVWIAHAPTFTETHDHLSPDGHWVVYMSTESGAPQVYVQSFPEPFGKWQISTRPAVDPYWADGGREILYRQTDGKIVSVPVHVTGGTDFEAGEPVTLFEATPPQQRMSEWQPTADGRLFYMLRDVSDRTSAPFTVVLDWPAEIEKRR